MAKKPRIGTKVRTNAGAKSPVESPASNKNDVLIPDDVLLEFEVKRQELRDLMDKWNASIDAANPTSDTTIIVGTRVITVHRANFVMALEREVMRTAIEKSPSDTLLEQVARYNFYAPLMACSTGELPTEAEFLKMDDREVNIWYTTTVQKNPHWFENPETEEKKRA